MPFGSFLILAVGAPLAQGHSRHPQVSRPFQQVTSERSFGNLSPSASLQTQFIDCANGIPGGYLADSISDYCCFGQVNRGLEGQGACCNHSGPGPHALLWSFLVAFLLLVLLLLIPARAIKLQRRLFSSAFCALACFPRSLELEGLLCSVISFLVIFFPFSFYADTEANTGCNMYSRAYSLASPLAGCKVLMLRRSLCCLYISPMFGSSWTTYISH